MTMKKFTLIAATVFLFACGEEKKPATTEHTTPVAETPATAPAVVEDIPANINTLLEKHNCLTCHKVGEKLIGPAYKEVAQKGYANEEIINLVYNPKPENWPGYLPMPAQKEVPKEDLLEIAKWINSLK